MKPIAHRLGHGLLPVLLVLLVMFPALQAQSERGTITGTILDASGAVDVEELLQGQSE
jgi:hypothetical protein